MAAVYDVQVKNQLCDYEKSLSKYPDLFLLFNNNSLLQDQIPL